MLFKDFLTLFDLGITDFSICDSSFDELKFYSATDDDEEDLFLYGTFDVLNSFVAMRPCGAFSAPCLFVSLDFFS